MLKDTVEARLPKAAREELKRLRANVDYYRGLWETAVGQTETPSRVSVQTLDKTIYLDDYARIQIATTSDNRDHIEIHLQGDDRYGRTVSVRSGASALLVHPSASNSISVEPDVRS